MTSKIDEIRDRIIDFLSKSPSFLMDISQSIEIDSTQTMAILDYFASRGELGKTERRYGSSPVYFLPEDKDKALNKLFQTLNQNEKAVISKIKSAGAVKISDLSPMERYISQQLGDFLKKISAKDSETGDTVDFIYYYSLSLDEIRQILNKTETNKAKTKTEKKEALTAKKAKNAGEEATKILSDMGFESPSVIGKDIFQAEYGRNRLKVTIVMHKGKSITKKDMIKFAGYSTAYKTAVFVMTKAAKIPEYGQYGDIIKIIRYE